MVEQRGEGFHFWENPTTRALIMPRMMRIDLFALPKLVWHSLGKPIHWPTVGNDFKYEYPV